MRTKDNKLVNNANSTADYKNNVVTIESSQSSSEAGSLDPSSAVNFVSNNVKVYNVNFANTYGQGAQVSSDPLGSTDSKFLTHLKAVAMTANGNYQGFYGNYEQLRTLSDFLSFSNDKTGCSFIGWQDTL